MLMPEAKNRIIKQLEEVLGEEKVCVTKEVLRTKATDTWPLRLIQGKLGKEFELPLCVVTPTSTKDVEQLMEFLYESDIPSVPYAGGSGVTGGAEPTAESVVIDLSKMNKVISIDEENLMVTIQPGVGLRALENGLNTLGYTTGHYPQSIELAQIGGLVATRSSGQFSTKYGNIEDLVVGMEVVLPTGELIHINNVPRRSTGPDLRQIFVGSEGILGVMTEVTLKIFPEAPERWKGAYAIQEMREGLKMIREIVQTGWKPAVIRLHDALEASMSYQEFVEEGEAILLILCEGPEGLAQLEGKAIDTIVRKRGGRPLGEAPIEKWLEKRNEVSELDDYTSQGVIVDTIEVAANWTDIANIYEQVTSRLKEAVPELLVIGGHSSHSYEQGTSLYFILGAYPEQTPEAAEEVYWRIWSTVMEITLAHNGTICHHHGIGKLRARWMPDDLGSAYNLLEKLKEKLDPKGLLNEGTLLSKDVNAN